MGEKSEPTGMRVCQGGMDAVGLVMAIRTLGHESVITHVGNLLAWAGATGIESVASIPPAAWVRACEIRSMVALSKDAEAADTWMALAEYAWPEVRLVAYMVSDEALWSGSEMRSGAGEDEA